MVTPVDPYVLLQLAVIAAVLATPAVVYLLLQNQRPDRRRPWSARCGRPVPGGRVVVHLVDDSSYEARVRLVEDGWLIVHDVAVAGGGTTLAGDCYIPHEQIRLLQIL